MSQKVASVLQTIFPDVNIDHVLADVKANSALLDGCKVPHDFSCVDNPPKLGSKYKCSKCGGLLNASSAIWYIKGLSHSKG